MSCAWPFYSLKLVQIFPKALHSDYQGGGDYMTGLVQTSSGGGGGGGQGPDPRPLLLLIGTPLVLGPELASRRVERSLLWQISLYIFYILFLSPYVFM